MADRAFPIERIARGDGSVSAARIECCDCESVAYSVVSKPGLNPKAHEQYFRNHGWSIGNGPRRDKCPECQKKGKPALKIVKAESSPEKPREMTRDERLIIMDKIRDVHDGDRYGAGWSDKKVSDDLGVPRAWVEDIRENVLMFAGGHDAEYEAFMAAMAPITADAKNLVNSARVQLQDAKALLERATALDGRISEIERMGRRIEKEIGR